AALALGAYAVRRYYASREEEALAGDSMRRMTASLAIQTAPRALYDLVANPERLASVLESVESVTRSDQGTSRWTVRSATGAAIQFEVEIVDDAPGSLIAWRTTPESQAGHHGVITFESGDKSHGTIVHVEIEQDMEEGGVLRRFFGASAESQLRKELKRLKQFVETGELATTRGQATGGRSLIGSALTRGET
ncbi:MAG TPA: SRPBCC family protein, partial [Povalibacter sp.]